MKKKRFSTYPKMYICFLITKTLLLLLDPWVHITICSASTSPDDDYDDDNDAKCN